MTEWDDTRDEEVEARRTVHEEDGSTARENDKEDMQLAVRQGVEESEDQKPPGRQTKDSRHSGAYIPPQHRQIIVEVGRRERGRE
ncbi:hypothetical protein NDU88_000702 [Pleurodeles waltl]|uniref:Uncharacterized protein n=1 Tax=Pleurodeles waltl TaxID=8319 RepID=A0AAV7SY22_PLEWA|nr:hypothetical protein NDU88_000702 [Pleurodeles waltl]